MKLLSIIIPSYNYGHFLRDCLASLEASKTEEVEVILVDGGSTDDSLAVAKEFEHVLDLVISEKDEGQSDAINKGFLHASGKMLTWLNADDLVFPYALREILNAVKRFPNQQWFAGSSMWLDRDLIFDRVAINSGCSESLIRLGLLGVFGPSSVFSKELYLKVGGIDKSLHYCMDRDLWYRFVQTGVRYKVVPHFLFALRLHEMAKVSGPGVRNDNLADSPQHQAYQAESRFVLDKYLGRTPKDTVSVLAKRCARIGRFAPARTALLNRALRGMNCREIVKSKLLLLG